MESNGASYPQSFCGGGDARLTKISHEKKGIRYVRTVRVARATPHFFLARTTPPSPLSTTIYLIVNTKTEHPQSVNSFIDKVVIIKREPKIKLGTFLFLTIKKMMRLRSTFWLDCLLFYFFCAIASTVASRRAPDGHQNNMPAMKKGLLLGGKRIPRGGSVSAAAMDGENPSSSSMIRVAYQGEPGAYSEKATRELLGPNVLAIGRPNFESAFRAVASMEVDYACLPIENSLGGSIHENYDLMLRYSL
jgi:hypothetical protein